MASPASAAATHFLRFRIQYSSIALIWYDYALTFPSEVKYVWGCKFRLSTILYIFCRYALVANVLYLLGIAQKLYGGCDAWFKLISVISVLGRFAVIATFTARTYAVYGRHWSILALLGSIGTVCVVCDIINVPGSRCVGSQKLEIANTLLSILMCIFEALSAALTTVRSVQMLQSRGPWKNQYSSFAFLVFKQGITYFSVVSLFTTAAAVLNFHAVKGSFMQRLPNAFTLPVSTLLTARFLLDLRRWEATRVRGTGCATDTAHTVSGFHAASNRALSSLISDFGQDLRASNDNEGHLALRVMKNKDPASRTPEPDESLESVGEGVLPVQDKGKKSA